MVGLRRLVAVVPGRLEGAAEGFGGLRARDAVALVDHEERDSGCLSWAKLVCTFGADFGEHLPDLVGDRVFGGEGVGAGSDGDLPVAA